MIPFWLPDKYLLWISLLSWKKVFQTNIFSYLNVAFIKTFQLNQNWLSFLFSLVQEYVSCEDRLMRSACGSHLADFTLALSMKSKSPVISASLDTCDVRIVSSFTGMIFHSVDVPCNENSEWNFQQKSLTRQKSSLLSLQEIFNLWFTAYKHVRCSLKLG